MLQLIWTWCHCGLQHLVMSSWSKNNTNTCLHCLTAAGSRWWRGSTLSWAQSLKVKRNVQQSKLKDPSDVSDVWCFPNKCSRNKLQIIWKVNIAHFKTWTSGLLHRVGKFMESFQGKFRSWILHNFKINTYISTVNLLKEKKHVLFKRVPFNWIVEMQCNLQLPVSMDQ